MTPEQMTRRMAKEIRQFYRVQNWHFERANARLANQTTDTQKKTQIRNYYLLLTLYHGLAQERLETMWRLLEVWANDYGGIPQRFDSPLTGKTKLVYMMATNNQLTPAQIDDYVVVDEQFPTEGLNKYQRCINMVDAFADLATIFARRMRWWEVEWGQQGTNDRETDVQAILAGERNGWGTLEALLADLIETIRNEKGNATDVPVNRLRKRYLKQRPRIAGGIQAINRGVTTTAGVPGGQPLTGTREPDEFNPDIDVVRDEPSMGDDAI